MLESDGLSTQQPTTHLINSGNVRGVCGLISIRCQHELERARQERAGGREREGMREREKARDERAGSREREGT